MTDVDIDHLLMTAAQVAAWAQVSKKTVERATKARHLRATKLGPQTIRYTREDVEAWVESRKT